MSTEIAMLLSAGIAGGISLLIVFISRLFDAQSEKRKEQENFFVLIFPKRLELYEDIIKVTHFIATPIIIINSETGEDLCQLLTQKCNIIADMLYRCNTYASTSVTGALASIHGLTNEFGRNTFIGEYTLSGIKHAYEKVFLPKALELRANLIDLIRDESGATLMDKKIIDFTRDLKIIKNIKKNVPEKCKKNTRNYKGQ